MRKRRRQILIGFGIAASIFFFMMVSLALYINSDHAHTLAKRIINRQVAGTIDWQRLNLSVFDGTIQFNQLKLTDPEGENIAQIERISLNWHWPALFRGELMVKGQVETPHIQLRKGMDGKLNLDEFLTNRKSPPTANKNPAPPQFPFNIVIQSLALLDGSLLLDSESDLFFIKIQGINLNLSGNAAKEVASIDVSFAEGQITANTFKTELKSSRLIAHYNSQKVATIDVSLNTTMGEATLKGEIQHPFEAPMVDVTSHLTAQIDQINHGKDAIPPLSGTLETEISLKGPILDPNAELDAELSNGTVGDLPVEQVSVQLNLTNRLLTIEQLALKTTAADLAVTGQLNLSPVIINNFLDPHPDWNKAEVTADFTIAAPDLLAAAKPFTNVLLEGSLLADGTLTGTVKEPKFDLQIQGSNIKYDRVRIGDGRLSASLEADGRLLVNELVIDNRGSAIKGKAAIQLLTPTQAIESDPAIHITLEMNTLKTDDFVDQYLARGYLNGSLEITGSGKSPQGRIALRGYDIEIKGYPLGNVTAAAIYREGRLNMESIEIVQGSTRASLSGTADILDPATFQLKKNPTIDITVSGNEIYLEDYLPNWKGRFSMNAQLHGLLRSPQGPIRVSGRNIMSPYQSALQLELDAQCEGDTIRVNRLALSPAANEWIQLSGRISAQSLSNVAISSDGIALKHVQLLNQKVPLKGKLILSLKGDGLWETPTVSGSFSLRNLYVAGKPIDDVLGRIDLAANTLLFDLKHNAINAAGRYQLEKKSLSAEINIRSDDMAPYFGLFELGEFGGSIAGQFKVRGNPTDLENLKLSGTLSKLYLNHKGLDILSTVDAHMTYDNGQFNLPGWEFAFFDNGRLHLKGNGRPGETIDLSVTGHLPLAVGRLFAPQIEDLSGDLNLVASLKGDWSQPQLVGEAAILSGMLTVPGWRQKIRAIEGQIHLQPDQITITNLEGKVARGSLRLDGTLALNRLQPEKITLSLSSQNLPFRVEDQLDLFLDSRLILEGVPDQTKLMGTIKVLDGTYYRDLLLNPMEMLKTKAKRPTAPKKRTVNFPYLNNLALDVAANTQNPFRVENNLVELDLTSDMKIQGKLNQPILIGNTDIAQGIVRLWNRQFEVTRGNVDFTDPYSLDPGIDIRAETEIRSWKIYIDLTGTVNNLTIKLSSNPSEQSGDILALILTGKTSREMAAGKSGKTGASGAALAALAGTPLGERLKTAAGIDSIAVDTVSNGETDDESTRVTLGKNLSDRMTLKYSMETKEGELVQKTIAEYQLLENILVSGFQDSNGIYGSALHYRIEFR